MTPRALFHPARLARRPVLSTQSDERLVDLVRAGSDPAFETIVALVGSSCSDETVGGIKTLSEAGLTTTDHDGLDEFGHGSASPAGQRNTA